MSIINSDGLNANWQLNMLKGLQCNCDNLKEIAANTDDVEKLLIDADALLTQILATLQDGQDFEASLVVDANNVTWLEVRIYNPDTQTFDAPIYFAAGTNVPGTPTGALTYINPNVYLAQIVSNTTSISLEATQQLVLAALGDIITNSASIITNTTGISLEATQQSILAGITDILTQVTTTATNTTSIATEATLQTVATTVDDISTLATAIESNTGDTVLALASQSRTPNYFTTTTSGSTTAGVYSFSVANIGNAVGDLDGGHLPAGVTVSFDAGALNNTLASMTYDATGTVFVITYIS
jgi:hypothetical protein